MASPLALCAHASHIHRIPLHQKSARPIVALRRQPKLYLSDVGNPLALRAHYMVVRLVVHRLKSLREELEKETAGPSTSLLRSSGRDDKGWGGDANGKLLWGWKVLPPCSTIQFSVSMGNVRLRSAHPFPLVHEDRFWAILSGCKDPQGPFH
jgi:hypothetical protein